MDTKSIWTQDCEIVARPALRESMETEVAVIGAGLAGLLIAQRLQQEGKEVVVLEAERIAGGQTKNTTAKITAQHGGIYAKLLGRFGREKAMQYAAANQRAVAWYRGYMQQTHVDCGWEEQPAYIYALNDLQKLQKEVQACRSLGLPVEFTAQTDLPFPVAGAVCMQGQAQFHPLQFIRHVAESLTIYENTRVKAVKDMLLYCDHAIIKAKQVVFACHYPFVNFPGLYFIRMHQTRSYVLALENAPSVNGMYIDVSGNGYSLRQYGDLLLFGGGQHRTGGNSAGGKYALLQAVAERLFPGCRVAARWSAQDCITADDVPYIGRFSKGRPNWYIATGFGKWGMSTSAVAAEIIGDLICGRENAAAALFTPTRYPAINTVKIAGEGIQAAKGLIKANLAIPRTALQELPVGQGGIVEYNGKTVGVYRESEDRAHFVQTQCPHLGCRLEWNPDEKSWDCPCHGSRYDYTGRLLDNPAQHSNIKED